MGGKKATRAVIDDDLMPFGTPAHHLHRREAPATSVAAANSIDTTDLEQLVYKDIAGFGAPGCTQDDILQLHPDKAYSSITARFASLLRKGIIIDTGLTRPGRSGRKQRVVCAKRGL
jgi:hypothetical protein